MNKPSEALWDLQRVAEPIDWDAAYVAELPRVYNFFLYKVGDKEFAQDLTATTFERAWKLRLKYCPAVAGVSTWLFGIARNVLKEHYAAVLIRGGWGADHKVWSTEYGQLRLRWSVGDLTYELMGIDQEQLIEIATSTLE